MGRCSRWLQVAILDKCESGSLLYATPMGRAHDCFPLQARGRKPDTQKVALRMIELETVVGWLEAENWTVTVGDGVIDGAVWHLEFKQDDDGPVFRGFCEGPDGEALVVQHLTRIATAHREAIAELPKEEFEAFQYHLTRDFVLVGSRFLINFEGDPWFFAISRRVWEERFDREALFSAMKEVSYAALLGTLNVRRVAERVRD